MEKTENEKVDLAVNIENFKLNLQDIPKPVFKHNLIEKIRKYDQGLDMTGRTLEIILKSFEQGKIDNLKALGKALYESKKDGKKRTNGTVKKQPSKFLNNLVADGLAEDLTYCPRCGIDLPKYPPKICQCGFRLVDEWIPYDEKNESQHLQKLSRMNIEGLNTELGFLTYIDNWVSYKILRILYAAINEILEITNNLSKKHDDTNHMEFMEGKEEVVIPIKRIVSRISDLMESIIKYYPEFYKKNPQIPWESFLKIGALIKTRKWDDIKETIWFGCFGALDTLVKGIDNNRR